MNEAQFKEVVDGAIASIQKLLVIKGAEYAGGDTDRLANFKRGSALAGVAPLQVLLVYLSKHYDAVGSYIRATSSGRVPALSEPIEGRFHDLINYCILAIAIIEDQRAAGAVVGPGNFTVHSDRVSGGYGSDEIVPPTGIQYNTVILR